MGVWSYQGVELGGGFGGGPKVLNWVLGLVVGLRSRTGKGG